MLNVIISRVILCDLRQNLAGLHVPTMYQVAVAGNLKASQIACSQRLDAWRAVLHWICRGTGVRFGTHLLVVSLIMEDLWCHVKVAPGPASEVEDSLLSHRHPGTCGNNQQVLPEFMMRPWPQRCGCDMILQLVLTRLDLVLCMQLSNASCQVGRKL